MKNSLLNSKNSIIIIILVSLDKRIRVITRVNLGSKLYLYLLGHGSKLQCAVSSAGPSPRQMHFETAAPLQSLSLFVTPLPPHFSLHLLHADQSSYSISCAANERKGIRLCHLVIRFSLNRHLIIYCDRFLVNFL